MRTFMLTSTLLFSIILVSGFTHHSPIVDAKDVVGTWAYSVPYAPDGYQKGMLIITEKEGKLSGFTSVQGYDTPIEKIVLEGSKLTFTLYLQDTKISFDLNFDKTSFIGKVSYSEGTLDITGSKKE